MTGQPAGQAPVEIERFLKGVDYPAKKEDLLRVAKKNNAPENVINEIQRFPGDTFNGTQDVTRQLSKTH